MLHKPGAERVVDAGVDQKARGPRCRPWPALRYLVATVAAATLSMSTSLQTITGNVTTSSRVAFFICAAALAPSCLPTSVPPVKVIMAISGALQSWSQSAPGSPNTMLTRPAGVPAALAGLGDQQRHAGGLFRGFDDDGATCRQGGADLARRG